MLVNGYHASNYFIKEMGNLFGYYIVRVMDNYFIGIVFPFYGFIDGVKKLTL